MELLDVALSNTTSATTVSSSIDYSLQILFNLFVAVALALDRGLLNKAFSLFKYKIIDNMIKMEVINKNKEDH